MTNLEKLHKVGLAEENTSLIEALFDGWIIPPATQVEVFDGFEKAKSENPEFFREDLPMRTFKLSTGEKVVCLFKQGFDKAGRQAESHIYYMA